MNSGVARPTKKPEPGGSGNIWISVFLGYS